MKTSHDDDMNEPFGPHMMIDAYMCDVGVLNDSQRLYQMMEEIVRLLDMHVLAPPYVIRALDNGKKDPGGWTGFTIIAESHISFHSFVKRRFITLDVYSCKAFDTEKVREYLEEFLGTRDMDVYVQERGKRYPVRNVV
jgi:S-adenosylmethionine decarboxylase